MISSARGLPQADIVPILDMLRRGERALKQILRATSHPRFEYLESHMFLCRAIESLLKTVPPKRKDEVGTSDEKRG
jgi:hypothetical protein